MVHIRRTQIHHMIVVSRVPLVNTLSWDIAVDILVQLVALRKMDKGQMIVLTATMDNIKANNNNTIVILVQLGNIQVVQIHRTLTVIYVQMAKLTKNGS